MSVRIRDATVSDVANMVAIHERAFPGFFLTFLGHRFLRRLYAGFVCAAHGQAIVAENGVCMVGYIVGTGSPEKYFRARLWSEGIAFAFAAAPALTRSPARSIKRLWSALRYRGDRPPELTDS